MLHMNRAAPTNQAPWPVWLLLRAVAGLKAKCYLSLKGLTQQAALQ